VIGVVLRLWGDSWWRKAVVAAGLRVSFALGLPMLGLGDMPAWVWLLPLVVMLLVYPVNTWADAPLFPTPAKALHALPGFAPLPAGARVLDAGCGLGHGLQALRHAYPKAPFYGIEWGATSALVVRAAPALGAHQSGRHLAGRLVGLPDGVFVPAP